MDIKTELESLDSLISRLRVYVTVDAEAEWTAVQMTLTALVTEAQRLGLPWGNVSEYATRLKHHLGLLLGAVPSDGHPREQHVAWALGGMQALRSEHTFGPELRWLSHDRKGSVH
jgi:hypothetical protein